MLSEKVCNLVVWKGETDSFEGKTRTLEKLYSLWNRCVISCEEGKLSNLFEFPNVLAQCEMSLCEHKNKKNKTKLLRHLTHTYFNNKASQLIPTTYLRLLISILLSLPYFASKTICRALQSWLDKWPELNINLSHLFICRVSFSQIKSWSRWPHKTYQVWHGWEVVREIVLVPASAVDAVTSLNELWNCTNPSATSAFSPWLSNKDAFPSEELFL